MLDFLRKLLKPKYTTLNKIEIKASSIIANYNYLQSLQPEAGLFPVLKANAYGHGLKEIASLLNKTSAPLVAIDSFPEAQIVYRYFKRGILILGEMPLAAYKYLHFSRTEVVVYNSKTLKYLARLNRQVRVHLFVNSGMNREGIKDLRSFIVDNKKYLDKVEISGFCSHLASADIDSPLNQQQEKNFIKSLELLRSFGYFPRWVHLGNSAAIFNMHNKLLTAYRPGLALYGYNPFSLEDNNDNLQPALELFSRVVSVQDLQAGESVSYDETYRVQKPTRIAVIPFGYFEGLDRRFSNLANLLLKTKQGEFQVPIAGRVCMNLTCLNLDSQQVAIGDIVKIISSNPQAVNSVVNLADLIGVIPYEILVGLQANIRREVV